MMCRLKKIRPLILICSAMLLLTSCGGKLKDRLMDRVGDNESSFLAETVPLPESSEGPIDASSQHSDSPSSQPASSASLPQVSDSKKSDAQDEALNQVEDTLQALEDFTKGLDDVEDSDLIIPNPS